MATMPYVGNNDFRGYLNYLAKNGDSAASTALNFVGNDGGIDEPNMQQWLTGNAMLGGDALAASQNQEWNDMRNYVGSTYKDWSANLLGAATNTAGGPVSTSSYSRAASAQPAPSTDFYGPGGTGFNG